MVTIGDVSALDFLELFLKEAVLGRVNFPQTMNNRNVGLVLVLSHNTIGLTDLGQVGNLLLNRSVFTRAVGEEDWADVGALDIGELRAVKLFLFQSLLVLLYQVVLVVFDAAG